MIFKIKHISKKVKKFVRKRTIRQDHKTFEEINYTPDLKILNISAKVQQ